MGPFFWLEAINAVKYRRQQKSPAARGCANGANLEVSSGIADATAARRDVKSPHVTERRERSPLPAALVRRETIRLLRRLSQRTRCGTVACRRELR
jgi:hypothetical protein